MIKHGLIALLIAGSAFAADKNYTLGWKSNPDHKKGLTQFVHFPKLATPLPSSASVLDKVPNRYDQGQIGSCVANSGANAFDTQWKAQHNTPLNPSRLDLYQNCLKKDGNFPRDYGTYTTTAIWVMQNKGIAKESDWPYNINKLTQNPPRNISRAPYKAVKAYDVDNTDGVSIKRALASGYPVMFGAYVYRQIFSVTKQNPVIANPSGRPVGGHEMLIVGYDDAKQQYLILNSWGTGWGDGGTAWISYSYIHNPRYCEDFAVVQLTR